MSNFALVSTVDTMGDGFPCHCVMLFETEDAAIQHAVDLIAEHDASVDVNDGWSIGTEKWTDPKEFLEAWQDNLGPTEYLHVKPVLQVKANRKRSQGNQEGNRKRRNLQGNQRNAPSSNGGDQQPLQQRSTC